VKSNEPVAGRRYATMKEMIVDSSYITPFIQSVQNVFETMLQLPVQISEPTLKREDEPEFDVSGIIGMSGDVDGSVVLSFPTSTAERIVSLFTGMDIEHSHEDFPDAIGELVNMVTGGAKAKFQGKSVTISCPSVVIGKDHKVFGRKDVVCINLPCSCDVGEFAVEVALKQSTLATTEATASTTA